MLENTGFRLHWNDGICKIPIIYEFINVTLFNFNDEFFL
jgi:hypothetical protein